MRQTIVHDRYSLKPRAARLAFIAVAMCLLFLKMSDVYAQSPGGAMTFTTHFPCSCSYRFECEPYILASGAITADTPSKFSQYLAGAGVKGSRVFFLSPGGDLAAGLRLGQLIREARLDTFVGTNNIGWGASYREFVGACSNGAQPAMEIISQKAYCYSSCAYAFLGGVNRSIGAGAAYGVHQFKSVKADPSNESSAQSITVLLARYLEDMGVDRRLMDFASSTSAQEIQLVSVEAARALRVDTTQPPLSEWKIDATDGGHAVLRVSQPTEAGRMTHLYLVSVASELQVVVVLEFELDKWSREVLQHFPVGQISRDWPLWLSTDQQSFPIVLTRDWRREQGRDAARFSVEGSLPREALAALQVAEAVSLESRWPGYVLSFWPNTTFGADGLSRGASLLLRQH